MEATIEKIVSLALKTCAGYDADNRYEILNEAGYRLQEEAQTIMAIANMEYNNEND